MTKITKKDLNKFDNEFFRSFYYTHKTTDTLNKFNITEKQLYKIIHDLNIDNKTKLKNNWLIDKELLTQYYIVENHTIEESIAYFKSTKALFAKNLSYYNLSKKSKTLNDYLNTINKDEFITDYSSLSLTELKTKYNILNNNMLYKIVHSLCQDTNVLNYNALKLKIKKQTLLNYYSTHTHDETCNYFKISSTTLNKLIIDYDIAKHKKFNSFENALLLNLHDELKKYIITEKHSRKETLKFFSLKYSIAEQTVQKLLDYYKLNYLDYSKNLILSVINSTKTKLTMNELANITKLSYCNVTHIVKKLNLYDKLNINPQSSNYEQEIRDFLNNLNLSYIENDRNVLSGKELDIYFPKQKVAIEFNGNYWHSSLYKTKTYHYDKSYNCEKNNIRLIHIYEYQWLNNTKQEILKSIIKNALGLNANRIYARKCSIKELKKADVEEFSENNSLHGHRNASIYLGLYYNEELVEIMTFGNAYFSKNKAINYECIRSITKLNTTVIGGMNKLLSYFISKYNPTSILYYVDYNTHNGNSMKYLGFNFVNYSKYGIINIATSKETIEKYGEAFNRIPQKNKEIKKEIDSGHILTLYTAGVKKYMWYKSND